jgi:hypothetical protein
MYARVVTVQVQPGKMDEAWRRLRELALAVQAIRGFHEARFLTDASTVRSLVSRCGRQKPMPRPPQSQVPRAGRSGIS